MRSTGKMIVIRQTPEQWQPFWMLRCSDYSSWKIRPGYTPGGVGAVHFRRAKTACLFRQENTNKRFRKESN